MIYVYNFLMRKTLTTLLVTALLFLSGCGFDLNKLESLEISIGYSTFLSKDFDKKQVTENVFSPYKGERLSFNKGQNSTIIKFNTNETTNDYVIVVDHKYLNKVSYFSENSQGELSETNSLFRLKPSDNRVFSSEHYAFSLSRDTSHFVVLNNSFDTSVMVKVVSKDEYIQFDKNINVFFTLLYSSLLALFLVNTIYYLFIKNSVYLYYALYLASGFIAIYWQESRMADYDFFFFPIFADQSKLFFFLLSTFLAYLFVYKFLRLNWIKQLSGKILVGLMLHVILQILIFFVLYFFIQDSLDSLYLWYNYTVQFSNFVIISIAFANVKNGNRQALFLLIAWSLFISFAVFRVIYALNPLPNHFWQQHSYEIGLIVEAFVLALGLADQALGFKKSRDKAVSDITEVNKALFAETLINNFLYESKQQAINETQVVNLSTHIENKFSDMVQKFAPVKNLSRINLINNEFQIFNMFNHDGTSCCLNFLNENVSFINALFTEKKIFSKLYQCEENKVQIIGIPLLVNYKSEDVENESFIFEIKQEQELTQNEIEHLNDFIQKSLKALANSQEAQQITKHAQEIINLAGEKERQMRLKDRFFANVSHEFRTPLTLTIAPLTDLHEQREFLNASGKYLVDTALSNAQDLMSLVDKILDIQKLETESFPLRVSKIKINTLVESIVENMRNWAQNHYQELTYEPIVKDIDLYCDSKEVKKVITNLIANAIKYSGKNSTIKISIEQDSQWIRLMVEDDGVGIPLEIQQHIFDRYYQVETKNHVTEPGTGIGLSYVKDVMELHQGTVSLKSNINYGSTFTLSFLQGFIHYSYDEISGSEEKSVIKPKQVIGEEHDDEITYDLKLKKDIPSLLVVEDNHELRKFLIFKFNKDYNVLDAKNGREGLEMAQTFLPDIIISDVMMPELDGIEMIKKLRSIKEMQTVPIILLTAKSANIDAIEGLQIGADDYIVKPFDFNELKARVDRLLSSRKAIRAENLNVGLTVENPRTAFQEKLDNIILENIADKTLNVDKLAHLLFLDRSNLYRKIKTEFDITPIAYIRKIRMEFSLDLLSNKKLSVSETAYACGFDSLSYFSKQFKKTHGISPSDVL